MKQLRKFRPNYLFAAIITIWLLFTLTWKTFSQGVALHYFYSPLTILTDTIPVPGKKAPIKLNLASPDTSRLAQRDTAIQSERTDTFSIKISKDTLDAPVIYEAADSVVILVPEKLFILYGKAKIDYKDVTLRAPKIEMDQQKNLLKAMNTKDENGLVIEPVIFKQGENSITSD